MQWKDIGNNVPKRPRAAGDSADDAAGETGSVSRRIFLDQLATRVDRIVNRRDRHILPWGCDPVLFPLLFIERLAR
jgi:hypothetical protein